MLFANLALARRLEAAQAEINAQYARAQAQMHPELTSEVLPLAGGYAIYDGVGVPLSYAVGLGLHGAVTAADLAQLEEFYHRRDLPAQVVLCPLADHSLRELLNARGYRIAEFNNVWFRPLNRAETFVTPQADVTARAIAPEERDAWARVVTQGFLEQDEPAAADAAIFAAFARVPDTTCFLGWIGEKTVAGGAVAMYQGVASLFGSSTLPAFRNRGAQTALLCARLTAANAAGCDVATTETEPGSNSQRNVERWGFRLAYTKMTMIRDWA